MALALNDRVQQTGTANTTVSFTLSGAVTGFQSFAVVGNGNTTYYAATDSTGNWEVGIGTYSTTGPTLTRTTILSSSNSGSAVTFSGTVNVFVTYPAGKSINQDASGNVNIPNALSMNGSYGTAGYLLQTNGSSAPPTWVASGASGTTITQNDTNVAVADPLTSFTATIAANTVFNISASISGTTLTVTTVQGTGTIIVGAVIAGDGVLADSYITALGTGTGGAGTYTLNKSGGTVGDTLTVTYSTMTVTAVASGTIAVGQRITAVGTAATTQVIPSNTFITALGTGTGGAGTYIVSKSFTLATSVSLYAGGTITDTVDSNVFSVESGGNMFVRDIDQVYDQQGAMLSKRLLFTNSYRTTAISVTNYFDCQGDGRISSADTLSFQRFFGAQQAIGNSVFLVGGLAAFGTSYGVNGPYTGIGFQYGLLGDVSKASIGAATQLAVNTVNAVVFGHFAPNSGYNTPKIVASYRDPAQSANIYRYNTQRYIAENHVFNGGISYTSYGSVTASTYVPATTSYYVTFSTTATCTVTLPPATDVVFVGTIDNGLNTAAGTTLTVTSVTTGTLYVGMYIYHPNGSVNSITAFGTGTGGVGTYTVTTSTWLQSNTFSSPAAYVGRTLKFLNLAAFAINSASANVVPQTGGAAGTAILAATAGKWCTLVFDGANWQIWDSN